MSLLRLNSLIAEDLTVKILFKKRSCSTGFEYFFIPVSECSCGPCDPAMTFMLGHQSHGVFMIMKLTYRVEAT